MKLTDYREAILRLAEANEVTEDVARDMFVANMEAAADGQAPRYAGAEDCDYAALGRDWAAMDDGAKAAACLAYIEDMRAGGAKRPRR